MLLYYITDRRQFTGSETGQRLSLLRRIEEAARAGIDLIQLREKDIRITELELLARDAIRAVRGNSESTRLLINSRADVAIAVGADGVHLTSSDVAASESRCVWAAGFRPQTAASGEFAIAVSCHSLEDVRAAESHGADWAVLAPIFEKNGTATLPLGLDYLRAAAAGLVPDSRVEAGDRHNRIPVLALGGVNLSNAGACRRSGAAGICGIRLFQEGDLGETVKRLRELG